MLRHALVSFYPRGTRGACAGDRRDGGRADRARGTSAAGNECDELHALSPRAADWDRADCGEPDRRRLDDLQYGPAEPAARCRRAPAAGAIHRRLAADRVRVRWHRSRPDAIIANRRRWHDCNEQRLGWRIAVAAEE